MTTIQLRRDTAANWTSVNPVLAAGEIGLETDTRKMKFGNGSSTWSALSYITGSGDSETVAAATAAATPDTLVKRDSGAEATFAAVHSTTAPEDPSELTRKDYVDGLVAPKVNQSAVEGLVLHDGTAGGGTRPSGFWRVRWVGGTARPTNMAPDDVWEHAV